MLHGKLVLKIIGPRKMKLNIHTAGYVVKLMRNTAGYSIFEFHYVPSGMYKCIYIYIYIYRNICAYAFSDVNFKKYEAECTPFTKGKSTKIIGHIYKKNLEKKWNDSEKPKN